MTHMDPIAMLLTGILVVCGYLALAQAVLFLYGTVCAITGLFYVYSGCDPK